MVGDASSFFFGEPLIAVGNHRNILRYCNISSKQVAGGGYIIFVRRPRDAKQPHVVYLFERKPNEAKGQRQSFKWSVCCVAKKGVVQTQGLFGSMPMQLKIGGLG